MKKKPSTLSDPRVLLTEAGEQQWLDQLLAEAATQQREKEHQVLPEAARRPAITKRPRKAA
jgi:hypothetical protein